MNTDAREDRAGCAWVDTGGSRRIFGSPRPTRGAMTAGSVGEIMSGHDQDTFMVFRRFCSDCSPSKGL